MASGIEKGATLNGARCFSEIDLNQQQRLKCAFDGPGPASTRAKVFPDPCTAGAELGRRAMSTAGKLAFPELPTVLRKRFFAGSPVLVERYG